MSTLTEQPTLSWENRRDLTAPEALGLIPEPALGFVYTPTEAYWIRSTSDRWERCTDDGIDRPDLAAAFELTVFSPTRQVRWAQERDGRGTATVLVEGPPPSGHPPRYRFGPSRAHLVWGRVVHGETGGWLAVDDARIGRQWMPSVGNAGSGDRLTITSVEYVTRDDHGNVAIADTRLTGLARWDGTNEECKR